MSWRGRHITDSEREVHQRLSTRINQIVDATGITVAEIARQMRLDPASYRRLCAMLSGARPITRPVADRMKRWLQHFDQAFPDGIPVKRRVTPVAFDASVFGIGRPTPNTTSPVTDDDALTPDDIWELANMRAEALGLKGKAAIISAAGSDDLQDLYQWAVRPVDMLEVAPG